MATTRRNPARGAAAGLLVLILALLVPTALVARWVHETVADTDGYVAIADELVTDPAVQTAVVDQVTASVMDQIPEVGGTGTVDSAVRGVVRDAVDAVVTSDSFAAVWSQANRTAQSSLVALLEGETSKVTLSDDGDVVLDLGAVTDRVRSELTASGLVTADRLPSLDVSIPLFSSTELVKARTAYDTLDTVATWAPWACAVVLLLVLVVANRRGRTLAWAGGLVLVVTGLVMLAVQTQQGRLADALVSPRLSTGLADSVVEVFASSLVSALRLGLVAGGVLLVVALVVSLVERGGRRY